MIPYTGKQIAFEVYDDDVECVSEEVTGTWRWGTENTIVVKYQDKYYAVGYRHQPEEGIYEDSISAPYEVKPVEKTVIEYVPV